MEKTFLLFAVLLLCSISFAVLSSQAANFTEEPRPGFEPGSSQIPRFESDESDNKSDEKILTRAPNLPSWSKLVFQSIRDGKWEIYRANPDGTSPVRVSDQNGDGIQPRLNHGANKIVFSTRKGGSYEVCVININGSNFARLTNDDTDDVYPEWSPDNSKILFQSYRNGQPDIYVMNANGSSPTRLTWHSDYDGMPTWSPDGSKIAFISRRTGGYRIWMMNADGSEKTQLSNQPYSENPTWSPDGRKIAYDSDNDGDGWQELWVMNADGLDQHQVYDAGYQSNAWARGWSADGRYVGFTDIDFINYQGTWYWTRAYLSTWDSQHEWNTERLNNEEENWSPDWSTTDITPPTSSFQFLPVISPSPIYYHMYSNDTGGSGVRDYQIQAKDGIDGEWNDWAPAWSSYDPGTYPGTGGHSYYFRIRARDNAFNVEPWPLGYDVQTTIEALPPKSNVKSMPSFTKFGEPMIVDWIGSDPGGSGIAFYDVQYQIGTQEWTNWLLETNDTSADVYGVPGETYSFRVRATDNAQNVESWPESQQDNQKTTVYGWRISGTSHDNRGKPITQVEATASPTQVLAIQSHMDGTYDTFFGDISGSNLVVWEKNSYLGLPETQFDAGQDHVHNIAFPPANNVIVDWGFESGSLESAWQTGGLFSPTITNTAKHSGNYAAILGQLPSFQSLETIASENGFSQDPQILVGDNGKLHVLWENSDHELHYSFRDIDGVWQDPEQVGSSLSIGAGDNADMAVGSNGVVHVVWQVDPSIYHSKRQTNGIWTIPQIIPGSDTYSDQPKVAVADEDTAHVVWHSNGVTYYAQLNPSGNWSAIEQINELWNQDVANLTLDDIGGVHVSWFNSSPTSIFYAHRSPEGTWSNPQIFASTTSAHSLLVQPNGVAHIAFKKDSGVFYATRSVDGNWSEEITISELNVYDSLTQLQATPSGDILAVWIVGGTPTLRRRDVSGSWGPIQSPFYEDMDVVAMDRLEMQIDQNGTAHLIWRNDTLPPEITNIRYARYSLSGDWTNAFIVPGTENSAGIYPELAVSPTGEVHLLWPEGSELKYTKPELVDADGDSVIATNLTVPVTLTNPTLSFLHQFNGFSNTDASFYVLLTDDITATKLLSSTTNHPNWQHSWFDISPWIGKEITLTFGVHLFSDTLPIWGYLDEVTLGSSYPDAWVSTNVMPPQASPGEVISLTVTYGNRGGVEAKGVLITDTLPNHYEFINATPIPSDITPFLQWNIGDMLANSGPSTITIEASVVTTATTGSTLINSVSIGMQSTELETANNTAQSSLLIGRWTYLPLITRE